MFLEHLLIALVVLALLGAGFLLYQSHKNHVSVQAQLQVDVNAAHNRINVLETAANSEFKILKNQVSTLFNREQPTVTANKPVTVTNGSVSAPAEIPSATTSGPSA